MNARVQAGRAAIQHRIVHVGLVMGFMRWYCSCGKGEWVSGSQRLAERKASKHVMLETAKAMACAA